MLVVLLVVFGIFTIKKLQNTTYFQCKNTFLAGNHQINGL